MGRYGGHHIPDQYDPDWSKHSLGEYWDWWHLGYEDGVWQTKWDYGIPEPGNLIGDPAEYKDYLKDELDKTKEENASLRLLLQANARILRQQIEEEIREDPQKQMGTGVVKEITETEAEAAV